MTFWTKTTIKISLVIPLFLILFVCEAHEHVPLDTKATNQEISTTAFIKYKLHHHFILGYRFEDNEQLSNNRTYLLGYRYTLSQNVKLLATYRQSYGLRHNEDWVNPGGSGWRWLDTRERRESIYGIGAQYKVALDQNQNHILKLRGSYLFNTFNDQQDIEVNIGHLYAFNSKAMSLIQTRFNFPANYARQTINYYSLYLGFLYSLTSKLAVGPQYKYMVQKWTEPISFLGVPDGEPYEVENVINSFGLVVNFYPSF